MNPNSAFTYYHPITVRYADLDAQGHVNNAVYLTYLESARLGYYVSCGIWRSDLGLPTGMVVARIEMDYLAPIYYADLLRVGLRVSRLGRKSVTFEFQMNTTPEGKVLARGLSVMVAVDPQTEQSRLIPEGWREKIQRFEEGNQAHETT